MRTLATLVALSLSGCAALNAEAMRGAAAEQARVKAEARCDRPVTYPFLGLLALGLPYAGLAFLPVRGACRAQ